MTVDQASGVEAVGVCRRYGRRWALADVSFSVPRGAGLVLAGRNGSGKSTLLRLVATAIRPDRGRVSVEGLDVSDRRDEVRRRVGLLSHASYLYEALTALDNLQVAARFLGRDARRPALLEELRAMGLADRADDPVSTFSAGMRKRLTFARVLLQQPSLVLLDEPYGQLDPPGFRLVDDVVRGLRARGATVVMATHQLERGAALCDHGLVLERGRVAWTGPAGDLPARGVLAADAGEGA